MGVRFLKSSILLAMSGIQFFLVSPQAHAMGAAPATPSQLRAMSELRQQYRSVESELVDRPGDIVMVFAHPDDELATLPQVGRLQRIWPERKVHWILVSDAAKGMTFPGTCHFKSKQECREAEAAKAGACFHLNPPHPMSLPDGGLRSVKDLAQKVWQQIDLVSPGPIAVIFTHDEAGLYGHADHLAVHDVVVPEAQRRGIPIVTGALTKLMMEKVPLRDPAASENRKRPEITHVLDLDSAEKDQAACAAKAHKSQWLLIRSFMQFEKPRTFYQNVPRIFMNMPETASSR
ncbi:MAG: PIG-L family deacetylase [Bdellovibrionales bacterium]|nr:PIG-L family deacetylase [Bdellovibrionales bacterium]